MLAVSSKSQHIEKALETIEYANSRKGRELFVMGIGRHWSNFKDGLYDLNLEAWKKDYDVSAVGKSWPRWWGWFTTVHGYIPAAAYNTFEEAMAHVEVWANRADDAVGGTFRWAVEDAKPTLVPNVMDIVNIPEAADFLVKLNEIRSPAFAKMLIAQDSAEIDKLWAQYLAEMDKNGFKVFTQLYQKYYETNLR